MMFLHFYKTVVFHLPSRWFLHRSDGDSTSKSRALDIWRCPNMLRYGYPNHITINHLVGDLEIFMKYTHIMLIYIYDIQ